MIRKFLSAAGGKEKIAGDVLRTLYLFSGALWLPELYAEYAGFVRTLGEEPVPQSMIDEAVKALKNAGLIEVAEGIRGTSRPEGERTYLISLRLDPVSRNFLSTDSRVSAYLGEWRKYFSK